MKRSQIKVQDGPKAIGPYSTAVRVGDTIYISGQLPVDNLGEVVSQDIGAQAKQCFENLERVLQSIDLKLDNVVKSTVYLTNFDDFQKMNQMYALYFGHPYPARTCIEVSRLPKDALIEIDAIAVAYDSDDRIENDDCGGDCK